MPQWEVEQPEMLMPPPSHSESSVFQQSQSLLLFSRFMVHIYSRVILFSFPFNSRRNANKRRKQSCLLLFPARAEQLRHLKATNFIVVVRNGTLTARAEGKKWFLCFTKWTFCFSLSWLSPHLAFPLAPLKHELSKVVIKQKQKFWRKKNK